MSAPDLVYAHSEHGFALISQRTETVQRMYFQCGSAESVDAWPDDRIWDTLQARVAGRDGFRPEEGPVLEKTVLRFRSFVQEPMRWGSMALAGDAAYTAPPAGARGLNLALHDVKVLAGTLLRALSGGGKAALDDYQPRALERVRRAQNFSYRMTQLLHTAPGGTPFDLRRQLGELDSVVGTRAGRHLSRRAVHRLASRLPGLTPTTIRSDHVITNCHGHFTTAPPQLTQWREQQVAAIGAPEDAPDPDDLVITDDDLRQAIESNQLRLMDERGSDLTIFSPQLIYENESSRARVGHIFVTWEFKSCPVALV